MGIVKKNRKTGKAEIIATTNAANILVDDPRLVEVQASLADVLSDQGSTIEELKGNIKWLYKYGGTGSGNGSGGSGGVAAKFEVLNSELTVSGIDNIIYISETKFLVKYRIFQQKGTSTYNHSVYLNGNKIISNEPIRTNQETPLTLTNLSTSETNIIRFTATDEQGFNLEDYTLKIISGSISITSSTVGNNGSISKYFGTGDIEVDFSMNNRIKGASTVLEIKMNNIEDGKVLETFNRDGVVNYRLKVIEQLNNGQQLETGVTYTITAQAFTNLGSQSIPSSIYTFTVSLMDNKSLIITLTDLSEESVPDNDLNLKTFLQGSDISFYYTVNAASYSSFRVAFEILDARKNVIATQGSILPPGQAFDHDDGHDLWNDNKLVSKDIANNFSYSTNKIPTDRLGVIYVNIYAWSSDGAMGSGVGGADYKPIKVGKCKIDLVDQVVPSYTDAGSTLYVNMDCPQDFSEMQDKDTYRFTANVLDEQSKPIVEITRMDLIKCNHVSSGFIKNSLTNNVAALRVAGESYANLDIDYFNGTNIGSWSLLSSGFTFSFTFKTDKHPDANGTVFSYGTYDQNGDLINGIDISLEVCRVVYTDGSATRTLKTILVQNALTTIDIVCEKITAEKTGFMKIYLDGSLTAVEIIENIDKLSLGILQDGAYFGCKKVNGELTNFCDANIYNCRIYKSSLSIPDILNNYIINYAYLNRMEDGSFNWSAIENLKSQNFISPKWICTLWDYTASTPTWRKGTDLYNQISASPVLPVLLLSETSANSTFHDMYNTSYNEANAKNAQKFQAPITMNYQDTTGTKIAVQDMFVTLQGTSSMSYAAKNLELYFGVMEDGQPRLFTPKDSWLPENQFTLKADVIDSAHANNTSIGGFVNGSAGVGGYFEEIFPMKFDKNPYAKKVKHTLEGFPIYMFFKFGDQTEPTFLGIYNFNLGRGSNHNMGFEVLSNYKLTNEKAPSVVSEYTKLVNPYNGGVFSFEFNTNSPTDLVAFQQPDKTIVDHILDQRYPPEGDASQDAGWNRIYHIFEQFSKMYTSAEAPKKWIYDNNQYVETDQRLGQAITPIMEYFPREWNNKEGYIFWNNACRYFCLAMAFGMVDSLGKNMTLRSWNVTTQGGSEGEGMFNVAFYDMDTALGLDNYGMEDVGETVYVDYWFNTLVDGYTVADKIVNGAPDGVKGYDMPCSRLWEVVRKMGINYDPGNVDMNYQSFWCELRKKGGLLNNVDDFMNDYYLAHTKKVGATIYNMDYSVKYLKKYTMENNDGSTITGYNDLKFLHGTRKNYVRSWLDKRLKYIDGCMNVGGLFEAENNTWLGAYPQGSFTNSPYVDKWQGRGNGSSNSMFEFEVISNTPSIMCMTIATSNQRIVLNDNVPTTFKFKGTNASSSTMSWNMTHNISKFRGFDQLNFVSIGIFTMSGLLELDLSNMRSFGTTNQSSFNIAQLSELRKLNLEGTQAVSPESGFIVDVSKCLKLKSINIRNSHVGSLILPGNDDSSIGAGVLSELLVSNSLLGQLRLQNQQFLTSLDFTNCGRLGTVVLQSMANLETVIFKNNGQIQSIEISNCPSLKSIVCTGNTQLISFTIDTCPAITTIDISNCRNTNLAININGAYNLQKLDLSNTTTSINPILPAWDSTMSGMNFYDTMHTLNLFNSAIVGFDFGSVGNTTKFENEQVLDLSHFTNLPNWNYSVKTGLCLINASQVKYVKFDNNSAKPYACGSVTQLIGSSASSYGFFYGMQNLKRVFGHISLTSTFTFNGCRNFAVRKPVAKVNGITPIPSSAFVSNDTKTTAGKEQWDKNVNLDTNITFGTINISSCFNSTGITLSDVYYLLTKCDNVVTMSSTFASCANIVTTVADSFRRETFSHCGKVTNMDNLFSSCSNVAGILYSPSHNDDGTVTAYNGLFSPLKAITYMSAMFWGTRIEWVDDMLFWKRSASESDTIKISDLSSFYYSESQLKFAVNTTAATMTAGYGRASRLFRYLPNLTTLSYYHNNSNSRIYFDTVTEMIDGISVTYCPLFRYCPNITSITNSFLSIYAKGSWENLFGGQAELMSKYPSGFAGKLQIVRNSFRVQGQLDGETVQYPIRNDMFTRIKGSLIEIGGSIQNEVTSNPSFSGAINKTYDPEKNDGDIFPWTVFKGCTKLTDAPAFFKGLDYTPKEDLRLPGSTLFKDCTSLQNLSYAFYGMTKIRFSLTSKSFINCQLRYVSYIFAGNTTNLIGQIPLRLFYMESAKSKTIKGWTENNVQGINEKYGFTEDGQFIEDYPMPSPPNTVVNYMAINNTVINMNGALQNFQSTEARPYTLELGGLTTIADSESVLRYNENYNHVKYVVNSNYNANSVSATIRNPNYDPSDPNSQEFIPNPDYDNHRVIINPQYDPRYRIWNEWCPDGSNIRETILNSALYKNNASLPRELPESYYDIANTYSNPNATGKLATMNFICPPDLLLYCANQSDTSVSYLLADSNRRGTIGDENYGLYGRIPPMLFQPINRANNVIGVFKGILYLVPYYWSYISNSSEQNGMMYPPNLLRTFGTNLRSIEALFASTNLENKCVIDDRFLVANTQLQNLKSTWGQSCIFKGQFQHIPDGLFSANRAIQNVSDMVGNGETLSSGGWNLGPTIVSKSWFTTNHRSINNISYFMNWNTDARGTVPEFWTFTDITTNNRIYAFNQISRSKITNINDLLSSKYADTATNLQP